MNVWSFFWSQWITNLILVVSVIRLRVRLSKIEVTQ